MEKTREEIRNMTEDEFWDYINSPKHSTINEEKKPLHFNTKEEWHKYYSDAVSVEELDRIIRGKYGV